MKFWHRKIAEATTKRRHSGRFSAQWWLALLKRALRGLAAYDLFQGFCAPDLGAAVLPFADREDELFAGLRLPELWLPDF